MNWFPTLNFDKNLCHESTEQLLIHWLVRTGRLCCCSEGRKNASVIHHLLKVLHSAAKPCTRWYFDPSGSLREAVDVKLHEHGLSDGPNCQHFSKRIRNILWPSSNEPTKALEVLRCKGAILPFHKWKVLAHHLTGFLQQSWIGKNVLHSKEKDLQLVWIMMADEPALQLPAIKL